MRFFFFPSSLVCEPQWSFQQQQRQRFAKKKEAEKIPKAICTRRRPHRIPLCKVLRNLVPFSLFFLFALMPHRKFISSQHRREVGARRSRKKKILKRNLCASESAEYEMVFHFLFRLGCLFGRNLPAKTNFTFICRIDKAVLETLLMWIRARTHSHRSRCLHNFRCGDKRAELSASTARLRNYKCTCCVNSLTYFLRHFQLGEIWNGFRHVFHLPAHTILMRHLYLIKGRPLGTMRKSIR